MSVFGTLSLTKIDEEYPDHKLSGAEFEVYRDVNGNKELDKEDTLLGLMEEMEAGFYEMKDVEFGGVLVREKTAPEGFYLDENVYYVSIESDGETYTVENKAGVGFINQAHRGNLKIIKTSSDGKLEGFTFRISGEDYDRTFTPGSDGIIFIENLRVGKYTVTELDDEMSEGYRRPDPVTVELVTDETLTVNVHNEKVTVDVPKTGDDSNLWIWGSLLA
ncbi:MAG: collagen binding domain-containing protein [Neglectibacter timonensis]